MKTFYTLLLVAFIGVQDGQAQSVQYRTMPRQELENLELKTVKDFENAQDKAKRAESRMKDAKKSYDDFKDRKSTRLNSSHANISYAVFCLKKKKNSYIH